MSKKAEAFDMREWGPWSLIGRIADPAPDPWWREVWQELTAEQRTSVISSQIAQRIKATEFAISQMNEQLSTLKSLQSMIKEKR